jgi:hypothetical protein
MSPALALPWEMWRRNRWGLLLLPPVLLICAGLSWQARRLQSRATLLTNQNPNHLVIPSEALLPKNLPSSNRQTLRLSFGPKVVYDGPIQPGESLLVEGLFENAFELQIALQSAQNSPERQILFHGPFRSRTLNWSTSDGRSGRVTLNFDPDFPQQVQLATSAADGWCEAGLFWSVVLFAFGYLVILGVSGVAEPHSRLGFTGIPPRRFTLPVSTALLAGIPLAAGVVLTLLFYGGWSWAVRAALVNQTTTSYSDAYDASLLVTGVILFQALVWGLPSFPKIRAWVITFLVLGLLFMAALPSVVRNSAEAAVWERAQAWVFGGLALAAALGLTVAFIGVTLERRGAWSAWTRTSFSLHALRQLLPHLAFQSPAQAQTWIEWRRNGRLALGIWMAFVSALIVVDLLRHRFFGNGSATIGLGLIAACAWSGIVGLNLARDGVSGKLALSSFSAVRPLTSGALVQAKLTVGIGLWAGAVGLLILGSLITAGFDGEAINSGSAITGLVLAIAISLHLFVGILPFLLLGRIPGFPWSFLPWLLIYATVINGVVWFERHSDWATLAFGILTALVTLKLTIAVWGFRRALRARISSWQFVGSYALLWVMAAGLLAIFAGAFANHAEWSDGLLAVPTTVLMVPLARVAVAPLALAANRHR